MGFRPLQKSNIQPNLDFLQQLQQWERELKQVPSEDAAGASPDSQYSSGDDDVTTATHGEHINSASEPLLTPSAFKVC